MTKEQALAKIEELKKYVDEQPKEEPKEKFVTDEDGKKYKLVEVDNE